MTLISSTLKLECDPLTAWLFLMSSLEEFVDTKLNYIRYGKCKALQADTHNGSRNTPEQSISTI